MQGRPYPEEGYSELRRIQPSTLDPIRSDRRNTRRQTRLDSYARLPVTMPTSSEEDEPVAPVPRSGRRAKKSRSTGRA
jgi:hypothetical protein